MTIAKAIARAWTDAAYKTKLVSDPHAALSEAGVSIPTATTVKVSPPGPILGSRNNPLGSPKSPAEHGRPVAVPLTTVKLSPRPGR